MYIAVATSSRCLHANSALLKCTWEQFLEWTEILPPVEARGVFTYDFIINRSFNPINCPQYAEDEYCRSKLAYSAGRHGRAENSCEFNQLPIFKRRFSPCLAHVIGPRRQTPPKTPTGDERCCLLARVVHRKGVKKRCWGIACCSPTWCILAAFGQVTEIDAVISLPDCGMHSQSTGVV